MNLLLMAIVGLVFLAVVAVLVGLAETAARDSAWQRIAAARREHHDWAVALRRCLNSPRCADCPINRLLDGG